MECVKCKKNIDENDNYCGYCGINQEKFNIYITKIGNDLHEQKDKIYINQIEIAKRNLKQLENAKKDEIERIKNSRWKQLSNNFKYNITEGRVCINNELFVFSDIKGAEIITNDSFEIKTTEISKSKKNISLGKAVVGGVMFGPIGAIAGGTMGSTKSKGHTYSNSIPICSHIGVIVDINGFKTEIVLLSEVVEQTSIIYQKTINVAQDIVNTLRKLSITEVPKSYLKPEEELSVIEYNSRINNAKKILQQQIDNKPTYEIPDEYYK